MMTIENENLKAEREIFEKEKARLLADGSGGKFVLIGQGSVVGVWDTYEDALTAGYGKFGLNTRFMVKKIEGIERVQFFTRDISCQV